MALFGDVVKYRRSLTVYDENCLVKGLVGVLSRSRILTERAVCERRK